MIVVVGALLGVLSVPLAGGSLRRLARLPIRHVWMIWVSLATQTVLIEVVDSAVGPAIGRAVHLGTYALAGAFLWANRRLPGLWLIALGGGLNLAAITANDGVMPASAAAWERAGFAPPSPDAFQNSLLLADARLAWLGDVFAIPAGWPLANVFSVGDIVVVAGATVLAHRWCRTDQHAAPQAFDAVSCKSAAT